MAEQHAFVLTVEASGEVIPAEHSDTAERHDTDEAEEAEQ